MPPPTLRTEPPPLAADEVHLWRIALDAPADASLLSPDELERAGRFHFARDRRRFVAARAGLRRILARYLGQAPQALGFAYGPQGKPRLAAAGAPPYFNLSHAEGLALVAVTAIGEVGVDLEFPRPIDPGLAARYFAAAEIAALEALPAQERNLAFFRCWTRKEAYLKACGDGVLAPLDRFEVSLDPASPRVLTIGGDREEAARWQLAHLEPAPGYVGAVALRAVGWHWHELAE